MTKIKAYPINGLITTKLYITLIRNKRQIKWKSTKQILLNSYYLQVL